MKPATSIILNIHYKNVSKGHCYGYSFIVMLATASEPGKLTKFVNDVLPQVPTAKPISFNHFLNNNDEGADSCSPFNNKKTRFIKVMIMKELVFNRLSLYCCL